jgi:hypothetical protein
VPQVRRKSGNAQTDMAGRHNMNSREAQAPIVVEAKEAKALKEGQ